MKNGITFTDFTINPDIIAPKIYGNLDRQISSKGIIISDEIRGEMELFLEKYIEFLGLTGKGAFSRIDAYFDSNRLYILSINTSFVDGWGNALNLTRSVGKKIDSVLLGNFPNKFLLLGEEYRPEFDLCLQEMNISTGSSEFKEIFELDRNFPTYVYGSTKEVGENIFPYNGRQNNDKINLARFSKIWKGDLVKVPEFILPEDEPDYSRLPKKGIVLKISSEDHFRPDRRNKVFFGKPNKWETLWKEGKLVAQLEQEPTRNDMGQKMQAIFLTSGTSAVTGYIQESEPTRDIINDNSKHSALFLR